MRAAVFEGEGRVTITTRDDPTIVRTDEVVVRVVGNGICGSDVQALRVPPGITYTPGVIIGHEIAGVVEAAGPDSPRRPGDRVVVHPNLYCEHCWHCRHHQRNLCSNMGVVGANVDGGAAEYCRVPSDRVFEIPDVLPFERAVLAEPLACVLNGTRKAAVHPGESLVVLGGGPIGLMYMMVLRAAGAHPAIMSEPHAARRRHALRLGADLVVDPAKEDVQERVLEATGGLGADVVVDCVGSMLPVALDLIRKGGRIIVFGVDRRPQEAQFIQLVRKEASVQGVFDANENIPLAVRLLTQNALGFEGVVSHRSPLDAFDHAVALARSGEAMKSVVVIDEQAISLEPGQLVDAAPSA